MTPAEISLRDQQLDEEGHDENCSVYNDGPCSGPPVCSAGGQEFPRPPARAKKTYVVPVVEIDRDRELLANLRAALRGRAGAQAEVVKWTTAVQEALNAIAASG